MPHILALDPGERVGWAAAHVFDKELRAISNGAEPRVQYEDDLMAFHVSRATVVVYERWILYPHKAAAMIGSDLPSSQFIGALKYVIRHTGALITVVDQPAHVKKTADKTMPEGFLDRATEPHDADALRHLWHYYWSVYV